jgi:hypothetical protein
MNGVAMTSYEPNAVEIYPRSDALLKRLAVSLTSGTIRLPSSKAHGSLCSAHEWPCLTALLKHSAASLMSTSTPFPDLRAILIIDRLSEAPCGRRQINCGHCPVSQQISCHSTVDRWICSAVLFKSWTDRTGSRSTQLLSKRQHPK